MPEFSWVITLLLIAAVLGNCSARGPAQEGTSQAGPAALRAGEYSKARTAFESALQSDPDSEDALAGLLETLRHVGEYEQADALASRHLAKKPASAAVRLEAGRIARSRGRLDEAEEHLRQAVSGGGGAAGDPSAEAERELAELLSYTGRAEEAARFWERLIERYRRGQAGDSDVMGHVAVAAWRTGYVHDAKDFFIDATEEGSGRPVSLRALADFGYLFLEKYNAADAIGCFRDCLRINPSFPPALVGIALAKKYESNAEVEKYARAALEVNPRFVPALNLLAELRFESEDHDGGLSEVRRALEVNPRDLDALSLEAVYHHARGDEAMQREVEARVAAIHPAYGQLYHALAEDLVRRRKYAEAVEQERKAIGLDPGLWPAYASLGINLMRLGDLAGGRQMIERAFQGDPFNVWAFNTLDLLDQMDRFVTVRSRNFVFLMSKEDEAVIAPYLVKIAEEAHGSLSRRYGFTPAGPIQVEVFPDHGGFAVRTLGLPGLGALGVCFGRVVAMDSPRAQKQGSFNWGSTLWHEFAHVITLQMTRHNIPRWFSEGLSVYEEHRGRPGWGDDLTAGMVKAYQEGKLLKVREFNAGLMRPKSPEQIGHTYYQAWLFCEMIDEKFGFEKLRQALTLFAENRSAAEVFRTALGWDDQTIEAEYASYLDSHLKAPAGRLTFPKAADTAGAAAPGRRGRPELAAALEANPEDFFAHWQMGLLLRQEKDLAGAEVHLKRAQSLFPQFIEPGNPYAALSEIYAGQGREDDALQQYEAWARYDETTAWPLVRAAEIYRRREEWAGVIQALDRAVFAYPFIPEAHSMLGEAALESGDWAAATASYQALIGLNPPDLAGAYFGLARARLESGDAREARRAVLRALEIAPSFEEAQKLLLKIREASP